jgi:SAM-dependent methyltransferase
VARTRAEILKDLEIGSADFVVEVGGGHEPFWRSNVIFDKYPFDNIHRSQDIVHSAPVLIADAGRLPLADDSCDLVFASHIIEHLPNPDLFLNEVKRCAKTVYLEFPGANRELMFSWAFHQWLVERRGLHLIFYRQDIPQLFGDFFHEGYDFLFDAWCEQRHEHLNSWVYGRSSDLTWEIASEGAFAHLMATCRREKVNEAPITQIDYTLKQVVTLAMQKALPPSIMSALVSLVRRSRSGSPRSLDQTLLSRLACPQCRDKKLRLSGETISCEGCRRDFSKKNGLFDLDVIGEPDSSSVS